ncbi:MAG: hypothetical protein V3V62_12830 [bacterium]
MRGQRAFGSLSRILGALALVAALAAQALAATGGGSFPPKVGSKAPQFEIQGFRSDEPGRKSKHLLLVFYRGFF